ncbi:MAG: chitobiase/beta-hexosaminidase C-terminal domain-containing protein [Bacteroidaceae bacterium]|nr:chitobiase/beta-hexosaminidase C-terminal domain-containing protein [Bacteroidaceae bacterium]
MKHFTHYITRLVGVFAMLMAWNGAAVAASITGQILFGSAAGSTKIEAATVSGNDSQSRKWTIVTAGTTSYTQNGSYSQVGSSKSHATSLTATMSCADDITITSFEVKMGGFTGTAGSIDLSIGGSSVKTGSLNGTSDVTVSVSGLKVSAKGKNLVVSLTGIAKGVKVYYIKYTYSTGIGVDDPTFSLPAGTYTGAQDVALSCETAGAKIFYTTDGSDPTESEDVYEYTGTPIHITTTTVITAYAQTDDDMSSVVAATYNILQDPTNTKETAYTVAEAKDIIDRDYDYDLTKKVYVKGKICQIDSYSGTNKTITYWISEDGTKTDKFEVYSGLGLDGAAFNSIDDIEVGAEVIVYGVIQKYNAIYEFDKNNQLAEYKEPAPMGQCSVSWSVNGTVTGTESQLQGAALTFPANPAMIDGMTFMGWTAATSVDPVGNGIAFVAEGATVPAQAAVTYYAVFAKVSGVVSTDTFDSSDETAGWTKWVGSNYSGTPKFKLDGIGKYVSSPTYTSPINEFSFTFKGNAVSGTSQLSVIATDKDNVQKTIKTYAAEDIPTTATTETIKIASSEYYSIMVEYWKDNGNVAVDDFVVKYGITRSDYTLLVPASLDVTIGSTGFSTLYYSDKNMKVPAGVSAWTYAQSGEGISATESYKEDDVIPAGEAVVLYTTSPATYTFRFAVTAGEKVEGNLLKGTDESQTVTAAAGNALYKLGNGSKGVAFYLASADGSSFTNGAHKAYLEIAESSSARDFFELGVGGNTTGIEASKAATATNEVFDLAGRRIGNAGKGLYIVNGKKVVK